MPAQIGMKLDHEQRSGGSSAVTLMDVSTFMTEQLEIRREHDAKMRQEFESKLSRQHAEMLQMRQEFEIKLSRQQIEAKAERDAAVHEQLKATRMQMEMEAKIREQALHAEKVRDQQQLLIALQARLEALHVSQLLGEEALNSVEDSIADNEIAEGSSLSNLIALSAKMPSDRAFARQVQRGKWV